MSFNKTKAMRNAERYLTQGKIQAAINEYRQIVDHEPKDVNSLNMLGDLYVKAKNDGEAATCYKRVAEYYNGQGFAKKAIAIYNKIHRIEPNSIEVSSKLAELYRMRGSYAEARNHYEVLAAHYESRGQKIEALAMWESIAELDPNNAEIYLKIAESYWNDGREGDASDAFVKAGKRLSASGNHESAVAALSRALEIDHSNSKAVEELVRSQITLGYPEEAAKILEQRIESDPYDRQTNFLLVDCYYDMGNPYAAENVIVKMVERDPSNYRKLLELTDVYFKDDDLDAAVRVISMISEHMLVGGEHDALLVLIEEVLNRNPEQIAALRLLARYHAWLKDEGELKAALERVAESAKINECVEDEYYALSQLSVLTPHDTGIIARIDELKAGNQEFQSSPGFSGIEGGEVPDFESYAVLSGTESVKSTSGDAPQQQDAQASDAGGFAIVSNSEDASEGDTLEAEIVDDSYTETENEQPNPVSRQAPGQSELVSKEASETVNETGQMKDSNGSGEASPETPLSAGDEMRVEEELESIRFYLEQGYTGLADKSITELETEFGRREEIVSLREQLIALDASLTGSLLPESVPAEGSFESAGNTGSVEESDAAALPTDAFEQELSGVEEAEQVVAESAVAEGSDAVSIGNADEEFNSYVEPIVEEETVVVREDDQERPVAMPTGGIDSVDVDENSAAVSEGDVESKENRENEVAGAFDESNPGENTPRAEEPAGNDSEFTNSFENLRDELGLEDSDEVVVDDFDNHYHHAVAYQEMGLMEEAIREYQDAINTVSPEDGTRRFLNCCTLLAHCFMEKGMANLGIVWLERAFESTGLSPEELNGLHYELANAYEAGGEPELAIQEFEKIYAIDVDYRDVGNRIEHLREHAPATA